MGWQVTATLGGFPMTAALRVPKYGVPSARCVMVDSNTGLAIGTQTTLAIGDASCPVTILEGGPFGGTETWQVVAGSGKWSTTVASRSYHEQAGVSLARAVADLGTAIGEARINGTLSPPVALADRSLGLAWGWLAGLASEALDSLTRPQGTPAGTPGQWWVELDGITRCGARQARAYTAPATLTIPPGGYDPSTKAATLVLADDAVSALLPGCVLTHDALPGPLTIGSVVIRVTSGGGIEVDACGEKGTAELFADLLASLAAPDRFSRLAPMQVAEARADGTASVIPIVGESRSLPIPGSPLLTQIPGAPGCTATLTPGAIVLVAWPGADPSSPTIVAYDPATLPVALSFAASTSIAINANSVSIGGAAGSGAPVIVDFGGGITQWIADVSIALSNLGHPVTTPVGFASTTTKAVP